jgi:hypothetical protein
MMPGNGEKLWGGFWFACKSREKSLPHPLPAELRCIQDEAMVTKLGGVEEKYLAIAFKNELDIRNRNLRERGSHGELV